MTIWHLLESSVAFQLGNFKHRHDENHKKKQSKHFTKKKMKHNQEAFCVQFFYHPVLWLWRENPPPKSIRLLRACGGVFNVCVCVSLNVFGHILSLGLWIYVSYKYNVYVGQCLWFFAKWRFRDNQAKLTRKWETKRLRFQIIICSECSKVRRYFPIDFSHHKRIKNE